jgi:hypothetical protein
MRLFITFLAASVLGCSSPRIPEADGDAVPDTLDAGGVDAGAPDAGAVSGCSRDSDCGAGRLCEECEGELYCVEGCRSDADCPAPFVCGGRDFCLTCPCGRRICSNGCRDLDRDGVWGCGGNPSCDSCLDSSCTVRGCDCDDSDPAVHPYSFEQCGNGRDENCDGSDDTACWSCAAGETVCNDTWQCQPGVSTCKRGCCVACPPAPSGCSELVPVGVDSDGCPKFLCDLGTSPTGAAVCASTGQSYASEAEAAAADAVVVHLGACLPGEGTSCTSHGRCDGDGHFACRERSRIAPWRCFLKDSCVADDDCEPPLEPARCDGGVALASLRCDQHRCVLNCP